jgi:SAM-dependent methyltransferase
MKIPIPILAMTFIGCFSALLLSQDVAPKHVPDGMHGMKLDSKAYIAMLENPQRDAEQKPDEVIKALNLKEGDTVADIGAGSGYFSIRFARAVGASGRVFAVDTSPDMVLHMNRRIRDLNLANMITVLSAPDDPLLPDKSIDLFFICNTWHHIQNRAGYLSLMKKMLRQGGRVAMIDYLKKTLPVGPPPQMKIAREDLIREMESGGFGLSREHSFLPHQYFLIFKPQ